MNEKPGPQQIASEITVLRAQLGESSAYRALFRRYNARLLYYLRTIVTPYQDADDLLQEVWITAIERIHTVERSESFRP